MGSFGAGRPGFGSFGGQPGAAGGGNPGMAALLRGGAGNPAVAAMFGGGNGMPGAMPPQNPMTGNTTFSPASPNPAANPQAGGPFGMLGPMLGDDAGGGGRFNPMNANPLMMNALSWFQNKMNQGG